MLRFGPRNSELVAEPDDSAEDEHPAFAESASEPLLFQGAGPSTLSLSDVLQPLRPEGPFNPPFQDTMRMKKSLSINRRPTLTVHT